MQWKRMVLASASPRRRELLLQIGIEPEIVVSRVKEVVTSTVPSAVVMELASQKARAVAAGQPAGTLVIGADTVVASEGAILGKPKDHAEAARMIAGLAGKTHQVYTGVSMILCGSGKKTDPAAGSQKTGGAAGENRELVFYDETDVEIYPMTEAEIAAYAQSAEPMDKAGAYAVQGFFARYIKGLRGSYANVMGLPVSLVYQKLKEMETE